LRQLIDSLLKYPADGDSIGIGFLEQGGNVFSAENLKAIGI
jgi:hypothetical protein